MVTIAYWDTQQAGRPPRLLGEFQGTPTIRLFKPKKKQAKVGSVAEKVVVDYRQERKVQEMQQFVEDQMTNYVERVTFPEDYRKAQDKAHKYGLAQAVFFTSKPKTTALLKYLSTEFRRRLLVIHVPPTTKNQQLMQDFGLTTDTIPALVIVKPSGVRVVYEGGDFSRRKVERFLKDHAASEPVYKPVVVADEEAKHETAEEQVKSDTSEEPATEGQKQHVEL